MLRESESSGGHLVVAESSSALYFSGADSSHQALKASFGRLLAARRRKASVGRAPAGAGLRHPAFARASASSFPGILAWPGTQRTFVSPCEAASVWNSMKTSCEESVGLPRRQVAAAMLSRQTTIVCSELSWMLRAALSPSRAPVASASKTSAG